MAEFGVMRFKLPPIIYYLTIHRVINTMAFFVFEYRNKQYGLVFKGTTLHECLLLRVYTPTTPLPLHLQYDT